MRFTMFLCMGLIFGGVSFGIPVSELESRKSELMDFFYQGEISTIKTDDGIELGYGAFVIPRRSQT